MEAAERKGIAAGINRHLSSENLKILFTYTPKTVIIEAAIKTKQIRRN